MRTHTILAILAMALLACSRGGGGNGRGAPDAGQDAPSTASAAPAAPIEPDDSSGTRMARRAVPPRPGARLLHPDAGAGAPKMAAKAQPDDRVMACVHEATDKASLMQCLGALKGLLPAPELPDAGPHKFAATRPPPINPVWTVPDWYVNPSTGAESNSCVSSGSPCKSFNELYGRWETRDTINSVATTVHLLADDVAADPIDWRPIVANGGGAFVLGAETGLCTGALASVVAKTYAAGTADGRLHADLGACASGNQGMIIENNNASRLHHMAWIDSCSGTVCAISQPTTSNATTRTIFPTTAEDDAWTNGDAFAVLRPTKAYAAGFRPKAFGNGVLSGTAEAAVSNIWIPDQKTIGTDCSQVLLSHDSSFIESRVDAYVQYDDTTIGNEGHFLNSWGSCGGQFKEATVRFGALNTLNSANTTTTITGIASYDVIVHGALQVGPSSNVPILGPIWLDDQIDIFGGADLFGDQAVNGILYGTYTIFGGSFGAATLFYTPLAVTAFAGVPTFNFCGIGVPNANAYDATSPSQYYRGRTVTPAALDAVVGGASGTGFGGTAYCDSGSTISGTGQVTSGGANYCAPVVNCGTGVNTLCTSGDALVSNGSAYVCQAVGSSSCPINLATCVSGTLPIANGGVNRSTICPVGQSFVSNGSTAYNCQAFSTCSTCVPDPVTVVHGGTGDTAQGAHTVLIGQGSANVLNVGPGGVGIPLVGQGASADPVFGVAAVTGGGTGVTAHCAHCVLVGQGSSNLVDVGPGAAGSFLTGQGASADPLFISYPVAQSTNSGTITTTLTTAVTISLVVATGQTAYIWATAWFESTDTNVHIILMALNATTEAKTGITTTGAVGSETTGSFQASDTTVGTNTYNLKFALDTALGAGVVNYPVATLTGQVR